MWSTPMEIQKCRIDVLSTKLTRSKDFYVNCGGHAFGVEGWYTPANHEDLYWDFRAASRNKGGWRKLERKFVKYILHDFPELQIISYEDISNLSIDLDKYEIIAFRIKRTIFGDYHFMRCERNGEWTEKRGTGKIYRHNYEDIYDIWEEYNGKLYFFKRERK